MTDAIRILGIDPGSHVLGYGVISGPRRLQYLGSGCLKIGKYAWPQRLELIYDGIVQIIAKYQPTEAAIEEAFIGNNPQSGLKLGQVRGVVMLALAQHGVSYTSYAARKIKQAVSGYGNADKNQVQNMVAYMLNLGSLPGTDAADGLAMAICHANFKQNYREKV